MKIAGENYRTIWFEPAEKVVKIIDQTKLPFNFKIISLNNFIDAFNAIKEMRVRGAPLIGATAAYALYLASKEKEDINCVKEKAKEIKKARPTAVT